MDSPMLRSSGRRSSRFVPALFLVPIVVASWVAAIPGSTQSAVQGRRDRTATLTSGTISVTSPVVAMAADPTSGGYWEVASNGGVYGFDAPFEGSAAGMTLAAPVVGMAPTRNGGGYWEVGSDGGIFAFGDAAFYGSMGGHPLNAPIVAIVTDPATGGYWEVASDGGIFAFGAPFYGSMGGHPLNAPIVGMAATPNGGGYWEVGSDGGIFAFGDAAFYGSMGGHPLNAPVVGISVAPQCNGYREVASDGGLFDFGDAPFDGSMGGHPLNAPVVGMAAGDAGYWEVGADGGIFSFGAPFYGSATLRPHPYLPPANPPANIPADPAYSLPAGTSVSYSYGSQVPACWTIDGSPQEYSLVTATTTTQCVLTEIAATNSARAQEGLGGLQLPTNFTSLSPQEQLFVLANLERVSRGESPVVGLSTQLDSYAQAGANANADPSYDFSIPSSDWYGSNMAMGTLNALDANYQWMYNDGYGGSSTYNVDCTSPSAPACWGHRDNILSTVGGTLVMGAGYNGSTSGYTELFVALSNPSDTPALYYTWAEAQAAGASA